MLCVWNATIVPDTMRDLSVHAEEIMIAGIEPNLLLSIANDSLVVRIQLRRGRQDFNLTFQVIMMADLPPSFHIYL